MSDFSPEHARRWAAWQDANVVSARRSDLICRVVAVILFVAAVMGAGAGALR